MTFLNIFFLSVNKNKYSHLTLDKFKVSGKSNTEIIELTSEQKKMPEMNEQFIKNERLISQEVKDRRNLEWLNAI